MRSAERVPYSAPHTLSACALSNALMNVPSSSRIRSGLAWPSCSCRKTEGSLLVLGVIEVYFFDLVVRDHSKDHSGDRTCMCRTRSPGSSYTNAMDSTMAMGAARRTHSLTRVARE